MCGISGIVEFKSKVKQEVLVEINDALKHRGPDHGGIYISTDNTVGLAQRRLSIIDLSNSANQPIYNEEKNIWLVYNGEIYNFEEIKKELVDLGHVFISNTDSEVIVHGYEEWGQKVLLRFRGMFAFALWDEKKRTLFAARDRVGIKPFIYYHDKERFIFASELKSILKHPGIDKSLNESAIYDYFTYHYIPTPKTILNNAFKLPPGHFLILKDGEVKIEQYWDIDFSKTKPITEEEAISQLNSKIEECVKSHLLSDVPVGVFLSGGLDSSIISAYAAKHYKQKIDSFTIGFNNWENSEAPYAKLLADKFKLNHHECILEYEAAREKKDFIAALFDEPYSDSSAIPTYFVSKIAREKVTVALSGDGGDEIFGGYSWYAEILKYLKQRERYKYVPFTKQVFTAINQIYPFQKGSGKIKAMSSNFWDYYCYKLGGFSKQEKKAVLNKEFLDKFKDYDDYWYFKKFWKEELDPFTRMQYLDMKTYMHDDILTKVDRCSMAVSLEVRVPLLDHTLLELVASFPVEIRNKNGEKKYLFKKAISEILPEEIINKKKTGFNIPLKQFFTYADLGKKYPAELKNILKADTASVSNKPHHIWQLICLLKGADVKSK